MKTITEVTKLCYDDIDIIQEAIDADEDFQIMTYIDDYEDCKGEPAAISLWLENTDRNKSCTLMMELSQREAFLFAKSLLAKLEIINNVKL